METEALTRITRAAVAGSGELLDKGGARNL